MDQPPKRGSWGWAILAMLAVGASGTGMMVYQFNQTAVKPDYSQGFDIDQGAGPSKSAAPAPTDTQASAAPSQPQSGLGMFKPGGSDMKFGEEEKQTSSGKEQNIAATFSEACRRNEQKGMALKAKYERKYPVIMQAQIAWMGYPDLKKINDDYMRNHDPIQFLRGLVTSKNLPKLLKTYATDPIFREAAQGMIQEAPGDLKESFMGYVRRDNQVKPLIDKIIEGLGLPPGLLGGAGPDPSKVDTGTLIQSMMQNNPDVQKALGNQTK